VIRTLTQQVCAQAFGQLEFLIHDPVVIFETAAEMIDHLAVSEV
jgi:hypothetical protein